MCRLDFQVRLHFFYAILAELKFVVKACFFKQIFSRTNRRQSKIRVNLWNLCLNFSALISIPLRNLRLNFSSTRYEIPATRYELGQTRRYSRPKSENSKKIFTIFYSLFYNDLSLLYPLSAVRSTLFFRTKRAASPLYRDAVFLSSFRVRNFYSLILSSVF